MRPYARTPISALTLTLCALVITLLTGTVGVADAATKPTTPVLTSDPAAPPASCPDHVAPPPPVDTSERPAPGQAAPAPLSEPSAPVGGPRMAECGVIVPQGAPAVPDGINAESWLLEDLDTGAVLAAKDPHARERPASLIKLLLSLVVTRELSPNSSITATQDDANQPPTRVGILPGASYPVTDLVDALLMKSGNDVAYALATALGGLPAATQKMNALAKQLGALDTRAATPSGLDGPGMSASAYDIAVIFRAAMTSQIISTAVQTKTLTLPASNGQPAVQVTNENSLLMGDYSPKYPGEIGGKTGFTTDAQHTYADAATQNGHRIALIMMRNSNDLPNVYKNATALLNYGFQLDAAKLPPVGQVVDVNPLTAKTNASSSTKDKNGTSLSAADTKAIHDAQTPDDSFSPFGTVGKPLTILAAVAMLLILVLVLRRKAARRKRAARAKALVAEKKAADAAKARAEAEAEAEAARAKEEPEPKPSTVGDTASWAAVDEAFAEMRKPSRPTPRRVGTGRAPAPHANGHPTGTAADAHNSTEPTEFFGRIQ